MIEEERLGKWIAWALIQEKEFLMKKMFHYLRPYRFLAIVSPLMMVGEVTADLLLPFLMSFIVNYGITGMDLTEPVHGSKTAIAIMEFFHGTSYSRMELIVTFGILMLVITLIGGLFGVLCAYTAARAAQGMGYDLRKDAYLLCGRWRREFWNSFIGRG